MPLSDLERILLSVFLAVAIGVFLRRMYYQIRFLMLGTEERRWDHVLERVKSLILYGIFQRKIAREAYAGVLHSFIFWAFVILFASVIEVTARGYDDRFQFPAFGLNEYLYLAQDIMALLGIIGVAMALYRRYVIRPEKLMHEGMLDATIVLLFILGVLLSLLGFNASDIILKGSYSSWRPLSTLFAGILPSTDPTLLWRTSWWLHVLFLFTFLAYVPHSKHMHIVFAIFNTFWRDLGPRGALKPVKIEGAETFGVDRLEKLSWKQLLDGYSCTECGRCQAACPAYITGKPLNPMRIITNMRDALLKEGPYIMRGDVSALPSVFSTVHSEDGIWSCTTCFACQYECPVMNEHLPKIVEMRRYLVLTEGRMPREAITALQNIETNYNPWGIGWDSRGEWSKGLGVRNLSEEPGEVEYLFWVGCAGSFDSRIREVTKAFTRILQSAGVNFAILGRDEKCTGDPARRIGNDYLAQILIRDNVDTLNRHHIKKIVTMCPHCFNILKNEYPQFGGSFEVIHHSELIRELLRKGGLRLRKGVDALLTYHDSCYLGRYNDIYDSPREVIASVPGIKLLEMQRTRDKGLCCGAGGGHMWMEETGGRRISEERSEEVLRTGAQGLCTACPFCTITLEDGLKTRGAEDRVRVLDIAEVVAASLAD